ncbi:putative synaptopodin-2 [Triplophysa rosa]|uniref:Synaptopodin-2 n=2 Tax=Triplophysa rosa TaxID=992332 RepID=A0A9W7X004_TRIRA|nr:putative synaptopodin-2 [Triplophysa rosa]
MEHLLQTKGKGVLMFAKRRQRMDELSAEQEEMRLKSITEDAFVESEVEIAKPAPQEEDGYDRQQHQFQEQPYQQQILPQPKNGLNDLNSYQSSTDSRTLVPNRTAKPFLSGHNQGSVSSPTTKKTENIFKVPVPVPVNTTPRVWSPTADIIASRDERIAIPAVKTGILSETKRRGASKSDLKEMPKSQKKGEPRSLTESGPEEDFLSLGAEACNFMQAPTIKQKNPPPVLPKPVINSARPPWSAQGRASRSPLPLSNSGTGVGNQVQRAPQQNPSQPISKAWTSLPSQPISQQGWTPIQTPALFQSARTPPVSPHAGPSQSKMSWTNSQTVANSVASCPPQHRSTNYNAPKASSASPKGYSSDAGATAGLILKGKGAELFARRQSRMEKFVVDDETVQANKARSPSPTFSMPSTWKYSSNVRAPPPLSYNPILSPFYPLAAVKQIPSEISPKTEPKIKEKAKSPAKHLNALDVMKHQPYQLDSSLFTYNSTPEAMETSSKLSGQAQSPIFEPSMMLSPSPNSLTKSLQPVKQNPSKASGQGFSRSRSMSLPQKPLSVSPSSPVSSPTIGVHPARELLSRQYSWVEQPKTPLSAWEEFAQSPLSLDRAKLSRTQRKSLPETPAEWKQRVYYESFTDPQEIVPMKAVKSTSDTFSSVTRKPILYGPPFRPAQPLGPSNRYNRGNSLPRSFKPSLQTSYTQSQRVSWKL